MSRHCRSVACGFSSMMRLATAASSGFLMARLFGDGALLANAAIAASRVSA
jgi:hypothetical protein